jgi:hydroxylamine dehydrogenase
MRKPDSLIPLIVAGTAFVVMMCVAIGFHFFRPKGDTVGRSSLETRATGRCASCHYDLSPQMVELHNQSSHAAKGVSCIDCHSNQEGQRPWEHHEFVITETVTSKNCIRCHETQYQEFVLSGHSLPAWSALYGKDEMPQEILDSISQKHPELIGREISKVVDELPVSAVRSGCEECHKIGRPNPDGSVGSCVDCHSAHNSSKILAAQPETCGRCHSGSDHQHLAIFQSSKHGAMFSQLRLSEKSNSLHALNQVSKLVPTCVTCHMGKVGKQASNHDVSLRMANLNSGPASEKRPSALTARKEMQQICMHCHSSSFVETKFKKAEQINQTVDQLLESIGEDFKRIHGSKPDETGKDWDELQHAYFEAWHQHGSAAKHGAFMGSPGHVVWDGIYQLQRLQSKFQSQADQHPQKSSDP